MLSYGLQMKRRRSLFRAVADGVGIDFEEIYKLYTARRGVDCFLNKTPLW